MLTPIKSFIPFKDPNCIPSQHSLFCLYVEYPDYIPYDSLYLGYNWECTRDMSIGIFWLHPLILSLWYPYIQMVSSIPNKPCDLILK